MRGGTRNEFLYRQEEPITQSDVDFAHFLRTRDPKRVARELFIPTIQHTLRKRAEQQMAADLVAIRKNYRKAS